MNAELCGLCFGCAASCPQNAIRVTETRIVVEEEKCNSCGICVKVCPVGAISLECKK
ncbi:MAG: 4Fe-4S binding protein [Candidatus Baldrarchaeia archaeon]